MSRRRRAGAAVLAAVLALGAGAGPARAESATAAELRALAARAGDDDATRERLERVDSVDGRPFAVGAIVAGARPDEIRTRVERALESAEASGQPRGGASDARARARELLDDRRYTGTDVPRPFTGALRWLGGRLEPVVAAVGRLLDRIPGGRALGWTLLALLVLGVGAAATRIAVRRGAGRSGAGRREGRGLRADDPAVLERAAEAAEREELWEEAVRLRFRAGLLRLDRGEVIAYRPSLTTGEVARALRSPEFDTLGREFDTIAYGGRVAQARDAEAARTGWRAVLEHAKPDTR